MTKLELRRIYKEKRLALSEKERMKLDDLLLIQLQQLPIDHSIVYLMTYWPLQHHVEPNAHLFTRYLQHVVPTLKTCYPVADLSTGDMTAKMINDETDFKKNAFLITEPIGGEDVLPEHIDLVFVPLLAFDTSGYRVGYGKGFYDRYLHKCRTDVVSVGFSYFDPVSNIDDKNHFDVPLNFCITPDTRYEF